MWVHSRIFTEVTAKKENRLKKIKKKKKKGEIIRAERKFHENVERGKYFMNIIADNDDRTGKYWTGI